MNFIRLFNFVSSVEEIDEIMLRLVGDFVFFAFLSKVFFDRTLLCLFFVPEPLGFPKFESSSKSTLWQSFYNDCRIKGALSGLRQFLATERSLKVMKNAFYFNQKLFLFSRYLSFCLDFLFM